MNIKSLLPGAIAALLLTCSLNAQVLMLDFGATEASGAALTNSPFHSAGGSNSHNTWNQIQTADVTSGLKWSDNSDASGISLNLGATSSFANAQSKNLSLSQQPLPQGTGLNPGTATADTIYSGTSVGTDSIYHSSNSGAYRGVGLQIGGLATGTYDIYITARNTSSGAQTQNLFVGKDTAPTTSILYSSYASKQLVYENATDANGAWSENENYVVFSVSITAGDVLNIVSGGTEFDIGDKRGFLNSVQIVAIPEPSTYAMIAGLGILGAAMVRRKVRANRA